MHFIYQSPKPINPHSKLQFNTETKHQQQDTAHWTTHSYQQVHQLMELQLTIMIKQLHVPSLDSCNTPVANAVSVKST